MSDGRQYYLLFHDHSTYESWPVITRLFQGLVCCQSVSIFLTNCERLRVFKSTRLEFLILKIWLGRYPLANNVSWFAQSQIFS